MTLNETYAIYAANPTDELSGVVYEEVLKYARAIASLRLSQRALGSIDEPIQDAATKVWIQFHKEGRYNGKSEFSTWVHAVIWNDLQDWLKRKKCRNICSLDDPDLEIEVIEDTDLFKYVYHKEIFANLQGQEKQLVTLLLNGLTVPEVAEKMGLSINRLRQLARDISKKS
jgi:RNA polymerase sigma factor (sigma-70 family)